MVATGTTDATGEVTLSNVPAGPYVLQVSAPGHQTYQASINVVPGITTPDEVFLTNQLVTYTWQVVPTEIQDQYTIQLQTTFATNVPAPVVTLSGPQSVPTLQPGQSTQINLTATNHGLIAAQDFQLTLPTDPQYTFTALGQQGQVVAVGNLPADSSVTIPVTVTFEAQQAQIAGVNALAAPSVQPADLSGALPCTLDIPAISFFTCDGTEHDITAATTLHLPGRVCDATEIESNFDDVLTGTAVGRVVVAISGPIGPSVEVEGPPSVETPVNCNACLANLGAGLSLAVLNIFTPLGEINTYISANNMLNSLLFSGESVGGEEATHTIADIANQFFENKKLGILSSLATLVENIYDPIVNSCLGLGGGSGSGAGPAPGSGLGGDDVGRRSLRLSWHSRPPPATMPDSMPISPTSRPTSRIWRRSPHPSRKSSAATTGS